MYSTFRIFCLTFLFSTNAFADWGDGQVIYETEPSYVYEGTGDIAVTGATLTSAGTTLSPPAAIASSSSSLAGAPDDAQLVKAYLVWAASGPEASTIEQVVADGNATLQLPNGQSHTIEADATEIRKWQGSATVPGLLNDYELNLGYYNVITDVTELLGNELNGGDNLNGNYAVSGVDIHECQTAFDTSDVFCMFHLTMGSWSLVIFYNSPETIEAPRRLYFYQGLGMFDADYPGVSTVEVSDFIAADTPNGTLYAMFPFSIDNGGNGDKITMNGCDLQNTCNDSATDLINGSESAMGNCSGSVHGIDLDAFDVAGAMNPGDTSASITMSSGSDTFITTYMALSLDIKYTGGNANTGDGPCEDGSSNGSTTGSTDGSTNGSTDGSTNGNADGNADGSTNGNADGDADGSTNGNADGNNGDPCNLNSDCPALHRCELGTCIQDCAEDRDCPNEGDICNSNGICVGQDIGDGTATAGGCDCQSNEMPGASFLMGLFLLMGLRWRKKFIS